MATEISEFSTLSLPNGAHFDYMKRTADTAENDAAVNEKATAQVLVLRKKLTAEDECLKIASKNPLTDEISAKDTARDKCYSSYKAAVKAMADLPEGDLQEAAATLWQHIKEYGIDTKSQLNIETGMLTNLCADLKGGKAELVATLGLTKLVDDMAAANDSVYTLMAQRTAEESTKVAGALKAARKETDAAYKNLIRKVNALYITDGEHDYTTFINTMNQLIKEYRAKVVKGRKSAKTTDGDTGGKTDE